MNATRIMKSFGFLGLAAGGLLACTTAARAESYFGFRGGYADSATRPGSAWSWSVEGGRAVSALPGSAGLDYWGRSYGDITTPVVEVSRREIHRTTPVVEVSRTEVYRSRPVVEVYRPQPVIEVRRVEPVVEYSYREPAFEYRYREPVVEVRRVEPIVEVHRVRTPAYRPLPVATTQIVHVAPAYRQREIRYVERARPLLTRATRYHEPLRTYAPSFRSHPYRYGYERGWGIGIDHNARSYGGSNTSLSFQISR